MTLSRLSALLLFAFFSTTSHAWVFKEHREIGRTSYLNSCESLNRLIKESEAKEESETLKLVACKSPTLRAREYGLKSALSGDHVSEPENFEDVSAEKQATSWLNYGNLALKNHKHFWPHVKKEWRKQHIRAVALADEARMEWRNGNRSLAIELFERSLNYSAFADHFLQDAFAIGHGGFSRIGSFQNTSLIFHDEWNKKGRWFKGHRIDDRNFDGASKGVYIKHRGTVDMCGEEDDKNAVKVNREIGCQSGFDIWFAYGDKKLNFSSSEGGHKSNKDNKNRMLAANESSISAVISTFVFGHDNGFSMKAESLFPNSVQAFKQESLYFGSRESDGSYYASEEGDCDQLDGDVYEEFGICWFDLDNSFMEPVYPDVTLSLGRVFLEEYDELFNAFYFAISLYSAEYFSSWPKNIRFYSLFNMDNLDYQGQKGRSTTYRELGFNVVLPNFYDGTLVSHEVELAYAFLGHGESGRKWYKGDLVKDIEGGFIGLNTNFDIMKARVTIGTGLFVSERDIEAAQFKSQIMIGWNFNSLGGGPIYRWGDD